MQLTVLMSWCFVRPILVSVTSYSPVRVQAMTPGSSVLMEKLTPSLLNLCTAWSSNVLELVNTLEVGHAWGGG